LHARQISSELRKGARLLIEDPSKLDFEFDEYCHWTFPDDDPSKSEPSYMMARRLTPTSERGGASASCPLMEAARGLLLDERPTVQPSGRRAEFIKKLADEKAAEEARKAAWAETAWHQVAEDAPFKKEARAQARRTAGPSARMALLCVWPSVRRPCTPLLLSRAGAEAVDATAAETCLC
jgi:hypothetical protein